MKKLYSIAAIALLGLCATGYQKEGVFNNGYSDSRVSQDTFVVTFRANEHTSQDKVMKYALRRAAHLARKEGFSYFTIVEKKTLHYPSLRIKIKCFHHKPSGQGTVYSVSETMPSL